MGIVYGGRTLKQAVDERDRAEAESGHSYGLRSLPLLDGDPPKLQRLYWKLITAAQYGRDTCILLSTSPASISGELLLTIATPEGNAVAASWGLTGHAGALKLMISTMAELGYDHDPGTGGINDGDIFSCNDPVYGSSQNNDIYTCLPLIHRDQLVGWVAGSLHIVDAGGALMPGMAIISPTTYTDGLVVPPMKTGQNFQQSKAWELTLTRRTRLGQLNIMDDKMKLVGAMIVRERLLQMVDEFGPDYFIGAAQEILERDRRIIVGQIKAWHVPWTSHHPRVRVLQLADVMGKAFPAAATDHMMHEPATCQFELDGTVVQDFRGASSENLTSHNIYEGGYNLGLYIDYPVLAMTPTINSAIQNVTRRKTDPGTIFNPNRTDLGSTLGCVVALDVGGYGLGHGYVQSRFARGFLEQCWIDEIMWSIASTEGTFANGEPYAAADWSLVSNSPMGVGAWRDGIACSLGTGNPTGDIGEAEDHEFLGPVMVHLARGLLQDAAAHGKYRGALGFNMGWLVDNPGGTTVFHFGGSPMGVGGSIVGLFGGYPALPYYVLLLRGTNARELIANGIPLPASFIEARKALADGTLTAREVTDSATEAPDWQVQDGDLIYVATEMGSSWGEPLDRAPERVKDDLVQGWISPAVAETVYGVVASTEGGTCMIDEEATTASRAAIKAKRKERAQPVEQWWQQERERVRKGDLPDLTRAMYRDCLKHQTFRDSFLPFWQLPGDYGDTLR